MGEAAALVLAACLGVGGHACSSSLQAFNLTYPVIVTRVNEVALDYIPYPKVIVPIAGIAAKGAAEIRLDKTGIFLLTVESRSVTLSFRKGF